MKITYLNWHRPSFWFKVKPKEVSSIRAESHRNNQTKIVTAEPYGTQFCIIMDAETADRLIEQLSKVRSLQQK